MLLIKNGRVLDPANGVDDYLNVLVDHGTVVEVSKGTFEGQEKEGRMEVIDAREMLVVPGLLDMHVHLREPGHEYKETIQTGCQAAAAGGFLLSYQASIICRNDRPIVPYPGPCLIAWFNNQGIILGLVPYRCHFHGFPLIHRSGSW